MAVRELNRRESNGLVIVLYWLETTGELYVEVTGRDKFIVPVPEPKMADHIFQHPFVYRET